MYRLFTAVDLPDHVKSELNRICFGLPGAKWVPEDQHHLTLRFIGEVDGRMFNEIKGALAEVRAEPFPMRLKGIGHYPPRKQPKVLWVGVNHKEPLVLLRNRIESILTRCGLEPEHRKFSPHITIARLKDTHIRKVADFMATNSLFYSPEFTVEEFHLYSSTLTPKGAIHHREASYP